MSDGLGDLIQVYSPLTSISLGAFCWAPVPFQTSSVNVVRPLSNDPASDDYNRYQIASVGIGAVGKQNTATGPRFPDKTLELASGEDLFVIRGKVRPVLPIFNPTAKLLDVTNDGVKSAKEMELCLGCLPAYTLVNEYGNPRHRPEFIENVRAMKYAVCCYLPGHPAMRDRETFLRMDRLIWLPRTVLQPMGQGLTGEALHYVTNWFNWFAGIEQLGGEIAALREMLLDDLQKARVAAAAKSRRH